MHNPEFIYLTWDNIEKYCDTLKCQMDRDNYRPEIIVGLLRGGVVPARIMADYFHVNMDFFTIDVKFYTDVNQTLLKPVIRHLEPIDLSKQVLIVDDIFDSGKTMQAVLETIGRGNIKTATLHLREKPIEFAKIYTVPNYYAQIAWKNEWIVYPWEKEEFKNTTKKG